MARHFLLAAILLASVLATPAGAQDSKIFSEFTFKELRFEFWPAGTDQRSSSDGKGSAITVHVTRVLIEGYNAIDLRYCIDGNDVYCPYPLPGGDRNGKVDSDEVKKFEEIVALVLRGAVERVDALARTLQDNITVDGMKGKRVTITRVDFQGAEGDVESNKTILADIDARVTYDNDPKATTHTIAVGNLGLKAKGFTYENAAWKPADSRWRFDAASTKPLSAKPLVNTHGFFSPQGQFETFSAQGIEFTLQQAVAPKKSPSAALPAVLVLLALVALAIRRS